MSIGQVLVIVFTWTAQGAARHPATACRLPVHQSACLLLHERTNCSWEVAVCLYWLQQSQSTLQALCGKYAAVRAAIPVHMPCWHASLFAIANWGALFSCPTPYYVGMSGKLTHILCRNRHPRLDWRVIGFFGNLNPT